MGGKGLQCGFRHVEQIRLGIGIGRERVEQVRDVHAAVECQQARADPKPALEPCLRQQVEASRGFAEDQYLTG
jgi:hypothetical protein